jgi:hypothetical protein
MRSYNIELPRGVVVDVFNLPDKFSEKKWKEEQ